ncbi:cell division suppressor protein YneA [Caldalkalibacillus salinus]|uniref:cell division suppressor protein YneA n=1 Tax=Caldalkalibacillus salinus TaxID=2803787 RepID=UPI001923F332|nr:LysM peptidoglycan-binding domain-containing protein [Caldalkalibacillus salinus]
MFVTKDISYLLVFVIVLCAIFYTMSNVMASAEDYQYEYIQVETGDTLWRIAAQHHQGLGISVQEYIQQVKVLNGLEGSLIYPGQELQVLVHHQEE